MDRLLSQNDYATLEERGENDEPLPDWGIQFSGARRVWSGEHASYQEYLSYEAARTPAVNYQTTGSGRSGIDAYDVMVGIVVIGYFVMILDTLGVDLSVGEWL